MGVVSSATNKYQKCIDECNKCAQACYECFEACLNEPDLNERRNCVKMLVECARMCEMSSGLMAMSGQYTREHCKLCATVCDTCAQECSKFKDDHCSKCAEECRTCSDECKNMAGM